MSKNRIPWNGNNGRKFMGQVKRLMTTKLPRQFFALPRAQQCEVLLDALQGVQYDLAVQALRGTGLNEAQAKNQVLPGFREGISMLDLILRLQKQGQCFYVGFGSAGKGLTPARTELEKKLAISDQLLGKSQITGGGPGTMHDMCHWLRWGGEVLAKEDGLKPLAQCLLVQILLHIEKERPNGLGDKELVTWVIDNLMTRTNGLIMFPNTLSARVNHGGIGTTEEIGRLLIENQLYGLVQTTIAKPMAMVMLSDALPSGRLFWSGLQEHMSIMLEAGTISEASVKHVHFIDVRDPAAFGRIVGIEDEMAMENLGYKLSDRFAEQNGGASVVEVAEELAQRHSNVTFLKRVANDH